MIVKGMIDSGGIVIGWVIEGMMVERKIGKIKEG